MMATTLHVNQQIDLLGVRPLRTAASWRELPARPAPAGAREQPGWAAFVTDGEAPGPAPRDCSEEHSPGPPLSVSPAGALLEMTVSES